MNSPLGLVVPRAQVDKVVGAHRAVELVTRHRQPVFVRHRHLGRDSIATFWLEFILQNSIEF